METLTPLLPRLALLPILCLLIWSDLRFRRIPNKLVLLIAALALFDWALMPERNWAWGMMRLLLMLGALALFILPFRFGWMGGGDVKLFCALALWCAPDSYVQLLFLSSMVGLALTLFVMVQQWRTQTGTWAQARVPYGIAIAGAAIWVICQPVINHLVA